ncbi:hypothetical protein ACVGXT_00965, partial [Enterobacter intestinihominis]
MIFKNNNSWGVGFFFLFFFFFFIFFGAGGAGGTRAQRGAGGGGDPGPATRQQPHKGYAMLDKHTHTLIAHRLHQA